MICVLLIAPICLGHFCNSVLLSCALLTARLRRTLLPCMLLSLLPENYAILKCKRFSLRLEFDGEEFKPPPITSPWSSPWPSIMSLNENYESFLQKCGVYSNQHFIYSSGKRYYPINQNTLLENHTLHKN